MIYPMLIQLEKTADILQHHQQFPRKMMSEKRVQKFHTDDALLPRSGYCFLQAEHGVGI